MELKEINYGNKIQLIWLFYILIIGFISLYTLRVFNSAFVFYIFLMITILFVTILFMITSFKMIELTYELEILKLENNYKRKNGFKRRNN